ncbi:hypothetical protein B0H10DRAFT_355611 [Mycena sp. CBHHK59/15]|nr:hypothetical protein B0H10DRAFT_355611 [Mycena sp. CBHHK59/15]
MDAPILHSCNLDILVSSLKHPMDATSCCAIALERLLHPFCPLQSEPPTIHKSRNAQLSVVTRATMEFLSYPHSDAERAFIKTRLLVCQCDLEEPHMKALHPPAPHPSALECYESALVILGFVIGDALVRGPPGKFQKRRKAAVAADAQPWPLGVEDIIPRDGGCRGLFESLMSWVTDVPAGHGVFSAIAGLVQFWPPFSREVTASPVILNLAISQLQHALQVYRETTDVGHDQVIWPLFSCAQHFFASLRSLPIKIGLELIRPIYPELYAISQSTLPIMIPNLQIAFPDAASFFEYIIANKPNFDSIHVDFDSHNLRLHDGGDGDRCHRAGFSAMMQVRNENKCMNPGCPSPLGSTTKACSRCGIVLYCGSEVHLYFPLSRNLRADAPS